MREWISVKDYLPKKYGFVLVSDGTGVCVVDYSEFGFSIMINREIKTVDATHWMPLPEPPNA